MRIKGLATPCRISTAAPPGAFSAAVLAVRCAETRVGREHPLHVSSRKHREIHLNNKIIIATVAVVVGVSGCASQYKQEAKQEQAAKTMPVNCATAQGDIATLQKEKVSVAQQAATGVSTFTPGGAVHVEVLNYAVEPTPVPGENRPLTIIGEADTVASVALNIPIGFGRYVYIPGGTFSVAPSLPGLSCPNINDLTVVATDEQTGSKATGTTSITC